MIDTEDQISSAEKQLRGMTTEELRDVLLAVRGPDAPTTRRKEELIGELLSSGAHSRIEEIAARVEATSPRKHVWLFSVSGTKPSPLDNDAQARLATIDVSHAFHSLAQLDAASEKLQRRLILRNTRSGALYTKFEHWVRTVVWKPVSATLKERTEHIMRHTVTAILRPDHGILEVRFDGFAQGSSVVDPTRLSYQRVASEAAQQTAEYFHLQITTIALQSAIERLLDGGVEDVRDIQRYIRPAAGGFLTFDAGEHPDTTDVTAFLASFLKSAGIGTEVSREQVRNAIRAAPAESMLLLWQKQNLITRIINYAEGPELLFIWRSAHRTTRNIEYVVNSLIAAYVAVGSTAPRIIDEYIKGLSLESVLRVTDVMSLFTIDSDSAFSALEQAKHKGLLTLVFRVRTTKRLDGHTNFWRTSLFDFPVEVTDEDGDVIALDSPTNIEVGYKRVGMLAE